MSVAKFKSSLNKEPRLWCNGQNFHINKLKACENGNDAKKHKGQSYISSTYV